MNSGWCASGWACAAESAEMIISEQNLWQKKEALHLENPDARPRGLYEICIRFHGSAFVLMGVRCG